jgi:hypothetical protein
MNGTLKISFRHRADAASIRHDDSRLNDAVTIPERDDDVVAEGRDR